MKINYRRNEDQIIRQIQSYIDACYSAHYASGSGRDTIDDWEDRGIDKENFVGNILKYSRRFGKKDGENPKDVIKIIHYSILLLNKIQQNDEKSLMEHYNEYEKEMSELSELEQMGKYE